MLLPKIYAGDRYMQNAKYEGNYNINSDLNIFNIWLSKHHLHSAVGMSYIGTCRTTPTDHTPIDTDPIIL